jgi:hypothetical protein
MPLNEEGGRAGREIIKSVGLSVDCDEILNKFEASGGVAVSMR